MQPHLVIVGGGLAGLVAANRAAERGLVPLVLEAGTSTSYPCNSRICGGVFHVAHRSASQPAEILQAAIDRVTFGNASPEASALLAERSRDVVDWMRREGIRFLRGGPEEYQTWVLSPPKPTQPGLEWKGRGGDVMMRTLEDNLRRRGYRIERGARVLRLLTDGATCVGVEVERQQRVERVLAPATVLADGGFQGNADMVRQYISPCPDQLLQRNSRSGRGDGIRMAQELGAATVDMGSFYGHVMARESMHDDRMWPYPVLDHLAAACIIVDGQGRRFTNEAFGGVSIANAIARLAEPLATNVIFDSAAWNGPPGRFRHTPPNPHLLSVGATMWVADSIAALAAKAGLPVAGLACTIDEYNRALLDGHLDALQPPRTAAPLPAYPIVHAPFYALAACAGISYTMGGLRIDGQCRVLNDRRSCIPGLYAAGATTGGLEGGPQSGYVGGLVQSAAHGLAVIDGVATDFAGSQRSFAAAQ